MGPARMGQKFIKLGPHGPQWDPMGPHGAPWGPNYVKLLPHPCRIIRNLPKLGPDLIRTPPKKHS